MSGAEPVEIEIVRLAHGCDLQLPDYATAGAAGADLLAAIDQDIELGSLERRIVPTGISIALPMGFEAQVRPRSGLAARNGITVANDVSPATGTFGGERNTVHLISAEGVQDWPTLSKERVAMQLAGAIAMHLARRLPAEAAE